ncbi:hypothetical protein A2154_00460 [Candidatus Gottesmanbacteria bacterium RBG_16_43_7]|uniref:SAM-dependent methyltransferase n=1 Tax=Candidatus Gottesmanbacteria bacterium RBG_16_43_7 TaxID=1798373 RepID=A0A1F5ZBH0_9BACT|nr:MAG: hypothetical protein A2154_00460 [Candidatus Gottesmanbacteria bacterium RBG_16_43_7]
MRKIKPDSSSFRDPDGFVFSVKGEIYRAIRDTYRLNYEFFINSGLYEHLKSLNYIIPHQDIKFPKVGSDIFKIIKPQKIPYVSYPYEWTFSELKDAALLTLRIELEALKYKMSLKDGSGYNIQFLNGKPVFIDTTSFEIYRENTPWTAYGQFCRHFLSPLSLMAYKDPFFNQIQRLYLDGISLDKVSRLLPFRSYFNLPIFIHIHLHAKSSQLYKNKTVFKQNQKFTLAAFNGIVKNLITAVENLKWRRGDMHWSTYYDSLSYSPEAFRSKNMIFDKYLKLALPESLIDIGANTGHFSKIAAKKGIFTIALDNDPVVMDCLYQECQINNIRNLMPLVVDITNPSPDLGWENEERISLLKRGPVSMVSMLAVVHHLAIRQNIPFEMISKFLASLCRWLIIEFIPKDDVMVQKLLSNRKDIFFQYNQKHFEKVFSQRFIRLNQTKIADSNRVMYLFKNKHRLTLNKI